MTKKEIVKQISEECGLTQLKTKEVVQKTFEAIIETLVEDGRHRIELRNFGVFAVKKRAARKARNPRTGTRVDVPAKYVVTFKPGKEMEERVLELQNRANVTLPEDDDYDDDDDLLGDDYTDESTTEATSTPENNMTSPPPQAETPNYTPPSFDQPPS